MPRYYSNAFVNELAHIENDRRDSEEYAIQFLRKAIVDREPDSHPLPLFPSTYDLSLPLSQCRMNFLNSMSNSTSKSPSNSMSYFPGNSFLDQPLEQLSGKFPEQFPEQLLDLSAIASSNFNEHNDIQADVEVSGDQWNWLLFPVPNVPSLPVADVSMGFNFDKQSLETILI